jgi:hypothetical protein
MGEDGPAMLSSVRTVLFRPAEFFQRHADRLDGPHGAALAGILSVALTGILALTLRLFARQFTGTTTVENPSYPGEEFCADDPLARTTPNACDAPPTVNRDISALLWEESVDLLPVAFVGFLILWLVLAVVLHVGAWLADGTGRFGETMAVTAFGMVPSLVATAVGGAMLVVLAAQADLSGSSTEVLLAELRGFQAGVSGLAFLLVQIGAGAWQAFLWAGGLRVTHEISRRAALTVGVAVAVVLVLLS